MWSEEGRWNVGAIMKHIPRRGKKSYIYELKVRLANHFHCDLLTPEFSPGVKIFVLRSLFGLVSNVAFH